MATEQIQSSNLQTGSAPANAAEAAKEWNVMRGAEFIRRTLTPAKRPIDMNFCNRIKQQVSANIHRLVEGASYELSDICGTEFWSKLNRGEVIKAGMCMAWMVRKEILPLTEGEYNGATKTYKQCKQ